MSTLSRAELPPLMQGSSAWYGPDLAARTDWIEYLSDTEVAEIERASRRLADDAGATAAARPGGTPDGTRLRLAASLAGRTLVQASGGDGLLRPGRPPRRGAHAERSGSCARPRQGSG